MQADEWLAWSNVDGYEREGVRMGDLSEKQRDLGYALLGAALSADRIRSHGRPARETPRTGRRVRRLHGRGARRGEAEGGGGAPRRHVLLLARRDR
ncbi:hypothetical protein [Streptomyces sp. NPDC006527]|uniref:hypothetical protein n=1 Tax=Streptomyces sp. NPDC006527 TaxID=3364749 RepID=UPI00369226D7